MLLEEDKSNLHYLSIFTIIHALSFQKTAFVQRKGQTEKIDVLDNWEATNYSHFKPSLHQCSCWQAI